MPEPRKESDYFYEIRDVSNDESYYTKGYFTDRQVAINHVKSADGYEIADIQDDAVILEVIEHKLNTWDHERGHDITLLRVVFTKDYSEENDVDVWNMNVEIDKSLEAPNA